MKRYPQGEIHADRHPESWNLKQIGEHVLVSQTYQHVHHTWRNHMGVTQNSLHLGVDI